jgi:UDP-glucose 4-epimerase
MSTVIITGSAGYIGGQTALLLKDAGHTVYGIDRRDPPKHLLGVCDGYLFQDFASDVALSWIIQKQPDAIVHCAGTSLVGPSVKDPSEYYNNNVAKTLKLLDIVRKSLPKCKFIFLSSAAVYGNPQSLPVSETQTVNPISPYGFHKLMCEQMCLEFTKVYGLQTASVRIFSAYGPGLRRQVVWDICQKAITQGSLLLQGTGQESRDFIHALDIARALSVVLESAPMAGEVYNLGTGKEVKISELVTMVLNSLEEDFTPEFDGVVPPGNPLNWQADISQLKSIGFTPTVELERGVKTFVNWCRAELVGV